MNQVLFLCGRNLCSSRVASALFNHVAQGRGSGARPNRSLRGWRAISRGLEIDPLESSRISPNAADYLDSEGIAYDEECTPRSVEPSDLLWSDRIVALFEPEHRPIIESQFPFWGNQIEYWEVPDFHEANWGKALPRLEANVSELISVIRVCEKVVSV